MQVFGIEAGLIEEAVLVLRVLLLRELVLLERFLRLPKKTETIPEVSPHIRVIGAARDRLLVVLDGVWPVPAIVVPVGQGPRRLGRGELRNVGRFGRGWRRRRGGKALTLPACPALMSA